MRIDGFRSSLTALSLSLILAGAALAQPSPVPGGASENSPDTSLLRDFSATRGFLLGRPQKARFRRDGKAVLFLRSGPRSKVQKLYQYTLSDGQTQELASAESLLKGQAEVLSVEEKARRERLRLVAGGFADYFQHPKSNDLLLPLSGRLFHWRSATGQAEALPIEGPIIDPQWSPDGRKVAYVRGYDVYVYDFASGRESAVTRGGTLEITHGIAEFVAQEEMRRLSGFCWSPDSRWILFEEADHRGVEIWNISDPSKPEQNPQRQFYPRPGKKNVQARLGITSVEGGGVAPVRWLGRPPKAEYLGAFRWDARGPLTVQWQDRSQRNLDLYQVDPRSGQTRRLLHETDPAWVNLRQGQPIWLPGAHQFLFVRLHQGWERLALVDARTGASRYLFPSLTGKGVDLTEVVRYDAASQRVHCRIDPTPGDARAAIVALDGTLQETGHGVSELAVSPDGKLRLISEHTLEHLPRTHIVDAQGKVLGSLPSTAEEPKVEVSFSFMPLLDGAGNLLYNAAIVKPRNFDPQRRYPVILDVYGGPHHIHVVQSRKNWLIDQWLADQGFIVAAIDNRGTPGRGVAWETAVFGKFGEVPLHDQIEGLERLGAQVPQMDLERVGIFGWSFGGYLSAQAVLRRPDIFKASVAGAPVTDWEDYDTHYTERYMGLLPQSRAAYERASLLPLARQLQRPLLLVHGTADDNVYYRNSLRLIDGLFRNGQAFEALPLAGITHSYSGDAVATERLWLRNLAFFRKHLGQAR